MEIQTTIKDFTEKIRFMNISPDTPITVTIETFRPGDDKKEKPRLLFLNSDVWDDQDGPADISENTDDYLYVSLPE
jgi:hypothetical protein